jgi:UDPglucose 6-dehydrogenase
MKVCVQGLWHLGSVTAACLASAGHDVIGLDQPGEALAGLMRGIPPIAEPGLQELLGAGMAAGRLRFTESAPDALGDAELLWVTYDTPVNEDDEADVQFVVDRISAALPHLRTGATVLVSSQLPVGSIRRLESIARSLCPSGSLGFACAPENLRLGKALDVFLHPDRIVVGVRNERDRVRIAGMLAPITDKIEWMKVESAEMTKHAINAFLATSVVFANEIALICEQVGADAKDVERGLKSESRIGPRAYLGPGGAFAGGTLARDVEFLKAVSAQRHLRSELLHAIKASNDQHKNWTRNRLGELFRPLEGRTVAVWGLTYKSGTDTLRRSLAVELCDFLIARNVRLRVHDPEAKALPPQWEGVVARVAAPLDALAGADALVVATEWPQYRAIGGEALLGLAQDFAVLDPNRFLAHWEHLPGIRYVAVGSVPGAVGDGA